MEEVRGGGRENPANSALTQIGQEERVVEVVEKVSPAVVSIVLTRDVPVFEQQFRDPFQEFFGFPAPEPQQRGTERREVGGGSGFFVSQDGIIVTNRHVVAEDDVDYTAFTNDGRSYQAEVLARDPVQDLAFLKVEGGPFEFVELGDSDQLKPGQTVVAIGNALGEFRNTVSSGVISGLGRTITASDGRGLTETIEDVIQTDAAINRGNSGGPLLNLVGQVVGVNTAMVQQAQSIGFAIPANKVKRDLHQVREMGSIVYPFLGIEYRLVTDDLREEAGLSVGHGALVQSVVANSAAARAGLRINDIVLEFDGKQIRQENSLAAILQQYSEGEARAAYNPGDSVDLRVLRGSEELVLSVTLGERPE